MEQSSDPQVVPESMEQNNNKSRNVTRKGLIRKRSFLDALREKYCVNMNDDNYEFVHIIVGKPSPRNNGTDAELAHLRNIVLDEHHISHAGIPREGLISLCPNVVDLDLASNSIHDWSELLNIISNLPKLKFVNISGNRLQKDKELLRQWPERLPAVENLVLNNTGISWSEVELLGHHLPSLKELHVCGNEFSNLDCDWQKFHNVECLRLNNNTIRSWSEVWKLRYLTNLKNLILSGNPLYDVSYGPCCQSNQADGKDPKDNVSPSAECSKIVDDLVSEACQGAEKNSINNTCWHIVDDLFNEACKAAAEQETKDQMESNTQSEQNQTETMENCDKDKEGGNSNITETGSGLCPLCSDESNNAKPFKHLHTLCLSKTNVYDWDHLQALGQFPSLSSVRITGIPLASAFQQDDRWMLYVASLPKVQLLNGSEITNTEREKSERFFLRHFLSTVESERPERYLELEKKHGKLTQIVDINLGARYEERPSLNFIVHGRLAFTEKIHVVGAVGKLRTFVAEKLGIHRRLFRMFHQSQQLTSIGELPELEQLFLDSLPMSRFDFLSGDEIHIEITSSHPSYQPKPTNSVSDRWRSRVLND